MILFLKCDINAYTFTTLHYKGKLHFQDVFVCVPENYTCMTSKCNQFHFMPNMVLMTKSPDRMKPPEGKDSYPHVLILHNTIL